MSLRLLVVALREPVKTQTFVAVRGTSLSEHVARHSSSSSGAVLASRWRFTRRLIPRRSSLDPLPTGTRKEHQYRLREEKMDEVRASVFQNARRLSP